jgi:hypothetical protein
MEKFGSSVSVLELSHGGSNTGATDISTLGYYTLSIGTVIGVQKNRSACNFKFKLRYGLLKVDIRLLV